MVGAVQGCRTLTTLLYGSAMATAARVVLKSRKYLLFDLSSLHREMVHTCINGAHFFVS